MIFLLRPEGHWEPSKTSEMENFCENRALNFLKHFVLNVPLKVINLSQLAFPCSKLAIETLEQGVKYVQG